MANWVNSIMEEKKYTAAQYAAMSGGQSIDETPKLNLTFVRELNESKMFRTRRQAESADARDTIDFAFLNVLALTILFKSYDTAPFGRDYAKRTIAYQNFYSYRQATTDLYIALHQIKNGKAIDDKGQMLYDNTSFNDTQMKQYLQYMANGKNYPMTMEFLRRLENQLRIQNNTYKAMRRIVADWENASDGQRALVITRLLQYYRSKAIRADLYQPIKQLGNSQGYILTDVDNGEKKGLSNLSKAAIATATGFAIGRAIGHRIT